MMYVTDVMSHARRGLDWVLPGLLLLTLAGIWEIAVRLTDTPRWFLPPPSAIGLALIENWRPLASHAWVTGQAVLLGFALAFLLGVLIAVGIASSRVLERSLYPIIIASNAIPVIALAPILLIWFGYGLTPKVIVVVLICFFPIAVNMVDGLRAVDRELINLLRSFGAGRWAIFRLVRWPASLPYLFSGTRVAAAVSVIGALVGEWVGSSSGLGYFMIRSASQFLTDRVFAAILVAALMGVIMFGAVALIERLVLPWQREQRSRSR